MASDVTLSLESQDWFYFTLDLNFEGHGTVSFVRFVDVNNDRTGVIVEMEDNKYFDLPRLLLLPYDKGATPDYFVASAEDELRLVWTFDGTNLESVDSVDLKTEWPRNILDKAAVTPFESVLSKFGFA